MRVGVIGAGAMGQNHIRIYSRIPGVELVGIADIDPYRVASLSREYNVQGYTDFKKLLKQDLDAVSIVVPTTLHGKVALEAIDHGTNLLIEKPICDTVETACQVNRAAEKQKITLAVGHVERFNPAVIKMKEIIQHGDLGKVVSISTNRVGPYNPRIRDVGVIIDLGVHDIDIISHLYGSPIKEVYALAGSVVHSFEDHASIVMRLGDDRSGVIETNWLTPHKARKLTAIGTEGVAYGDYMEQKVSIHYKEWINESRIEKKEPLASELQDFLQACEKGTEPAATGRDGVHALQVAIAAIRSYQSRAAVKIDGAPDARAPDGRHGKKFAHKVQRVSIG